MIDSIQARLAAAHSAAGPKHQILREAILGAISSGEWAPGMRLPTEAELSKLLPYSLGTIQKAFGQLVQDGLVVRSRGRGSFIAPPQRQMADPRHCRFLGADGEILPIYPRLVGQHRVRQEKRWAELFGAGVRLACIDRIISINHEFEVLSRFYAPAAITQKLFRLGRENVETANFKAILLRELGMPISRIVQTIVPTDTSPVKGLRWRPHLLLEATAYTSEGEVAYFQEIYIPSVTHRLLFESDLRL